MGKLLKSGGGGKLRRWNHAEGRGEAVWCWRLTAIRTQRIGITGWLHARRKAHRVGP